MDGGREQNKGRSGLGGGRIGGRGLHSILSSLLGQETLHGASRTSASKFAGTDLSGSLEQAGGK